MTDTDTTAQARREMLAQINHAPGSREALEAEHGQVWNTEELQRDFQITGFLAPVVGAVRRSDGQRGSLLFQARPRFYFGWSAE